MTWFWVAIGGAIGAPLRYLIDQAVQRRTRSAFPWGTWTVNVAGSALLGVLLGLVANHGLSPAMAVATTTGLCGALTTFSTFSLETARLIETDRIALALANVASSLVAGFVALSLGWWIAS